MSLIRYVVSAAALAALACLPAQAVAGQRAVVPLMTGWHFHLGAAPAAASGAGFDDSAWQSVSLPHSWNRMGGTATRRADYQDFHGPGWYRLHFTTPADAAGREAWLQFDAASIVADVWLNGQHLGRHSGAFARFRFDATQALSPKGDNLLVVRVDNSRPDAPGSPTTDVPPMSGDFPMYGGLYRPVSLVLTDPAHIAMRDWGGPGVYAQTLKVAGKTASIALTTRLENDRRASVPLTVEASILDRDGHVVARAAEHRTLAAGTSGKVAQKLTVADAHLWNGVADPYLYTVRVDLRDAHGGVIDSVSQPLGIRTFHIDPNKGFFLNGRHVDLHGVSRHQDRPGKGWAIDNADIDEDFALIKELGANTVRLAHYQHAQRAYDDADRDGIVAWAEIPLVDRSAPAGQVETPPAFARNAGQQLRELIRQNYNHPSIIVWSIANEVNLQAAKGKGASHARPLLEALQREVHAEDPSRPATLADCCGSIPSEARPGLDTVAGITDVIGFNRYYGWYSSNVHALAPDLKRLHTLYPNEPISISEYGAGGALTQHTDDPRGGPIAAFGRPHPEEFQSYILEETWKQIAETPFLWASWVWNLTDFSNEERTEGDLTDTNDKGLVTFDRKTKKDAFYFFKANWSRSPFVHLTGRRYVDRPYPVLDVKAYSNLPRVRLSLNGRDLGFAPCRMGICLWHDVRLDHGVNRLEASGAGAAPDAIEWRFAGEPGHYAIRAGTLTGGRGADGTRWGSDVFFTGGEGHFRDPPPTGRGAKPAPPHLVAGTADQVAYESWRDGAFAYTVPVPAGSYRVTLHFFEPEADTKPGDRVFRILAEGSAEGAPIDIVREAGKPMTALTHSFRVPVRDGTLDLAFESVKGKALVSGLEIVPVRQ
ncbi:MAG: glycoside hydrolase family 2 TIM barrel-domain containing protein [Sphingomonas sp.]